MKFILVVTTLFFSANVFSATGEKANVVEFDIAGVKLGMTEKEAVNALKDFLEIDEDKIGRKGNFVNQITNQKEDKFVFVTTDSYSVTVFFAENIPPYADGDTVVVDQVSFRQPGGTKEIREDFKRRAFLKYGDPSVDHPTGPFWCTAVNNFKSHCERNSGSTLNYAGGVLSLKGNIQKKLVKQYISTQTIEKEVKF